MSVYVAEFIGTMLLILLGNGVVANVVLKDTKGSSSGWIVIVFGWAMGVFVGVFCVAEISAHINPAVTIGLAIAGKFEFGLIPGYLAAQFAGAATGAFLVWLVYRDHFNVTDDPDGKLACFCTGPAIRNPISNLVSEIVGTFVLVYGVLKIVSPEGDFVSLNAIPVAFLVLAIGLSLGGTTGYAINPARDLAPRVVHFFLPIPNKRDSDWGYAWIPIVGPVIGATLAALLFRAIG